MTKLDPNGTVLRVTPVSHPFSLRFGPDGDLYVAQTVPGLISRITPAGDVFPFSSAVFQPSYMAFADNGDMFVSSVYYATVTRIRPDGTGTIFVNLGGGGSQVAGLAFAANGDLVWSKYSADLKSSVPRGFVRP